MRSVSLYLFLLLCLCACAGRNQPTDARHTDSPSIMYTRVHAFGCLYNDTTHFVPLRCGLYRNERGEIAFLSKEFLERGQELRDVFLTSVYDADTTDTLNGGMQAMRDVVDTNSFRILGTFYLQDKNHVYDMNPMSDGGNIGINRKIDGKTFRLLENDAFAKDKGHCYYRGSVIEGADLHSFQMLDTAAAPLVAFDRHHYYEGYEPLPAEAVKRQGLDSIRKKKYGY